MSIQIGSSPIKGIFISDKPAQAVYVGNQCVWSGTKHIRTELHYGVDYTDIVFKKPWDKEWEIYEGSKTQDIDLPIGTQFYIQAGSIFDENFPNVYVEKYSIYDQNLGSEDAPFTLTEDIVIDVWALAEITVYNPFHNDPPQGNDTLEFSYSGYISPDRQILDYITLTYLSGESVTLSFIAGTEFSFGYESSYAGYLDYQTNPELGNGTTGLLLDNYSIHFIKYSG